MSDKTLFLFVTEFEFSPITVSSSLNVETKAFRLFSVPAGKLLVLKDKIGISNALNYLHQVDKMVEFDRVVQLGCLGGFLPLDVGDIVEADATVFIDFDVGGLKKFEDELADFQFVKGLKFSQGCDFGRVVVGTSSCLGLPEFHEIHCLKYGVGAKDMEAAAVHSFCINTMKSYRMVKAVSDIVGHVGDTSFEENYLSNRDYHKFVQDLLVWGESYPHTKQKPSVYPVPSCRNSNIFRKK